MRTSAVALAAALLATAPSAARAHADEWPHGHAAENGHAAGPDAPAAEAAAPTHSHGSSGSIPVALRAAAGAAAIALAFAALAAWHRRRKGG